MKCEKCGSKMVFEGYVCLVYNKEQKQYIEHKIGFWRYYYGKIMSYFGIHIVPQEFK